MKKMVNAVNFENECGKSRCEPRKFNEKKKSNRNEMSEIKLPEQT